MYNIKFSRRFKKSEKRLKHSGDYDKEKTNRVIRMLSEGIELPSIYRDHELRGDFAGNKACHIESDLVLIYQIDQENLSIILANIGSHSDLFG